MKNQKQPKIIIFYAHSFNLVEINEGKSSKKINDKEVEGRKEEEEQS
jgi:hypothetical protein